MAGLEPQFKPFEQHLAIGLRRGLELRSLSSFPVTYKTRAYRNSKPPRLGNLIGLSDSSNNQHTSLTSKTALVFQNHGCEDPGISSRQNNPFQTDMRVDQTRETTKNDDCHHSMGKVTHGDFRTRNIDQPPCMLYGYTFIIDRTLIQELQKMMQLKESTLKKPNEHSSLLSFLENLSLSALPWTKQLARPRFFHVWILMTLILRNGGEPTQKQYDTHTQTTGRQAGRRGRANT